MTFDDSEEDALERILSMLDVGKNNFQILNEEKCSLTFQGLEIDKMQRMIVREGKGVRLTFTEFEILYLLTSSPGRVFSKEQIYNLVWEEPYSGDYNIVMSHIRNIREKIEDNPSKPVYIQTVWGVGYRFNQKMVK